MSTANFRRDTILITGVGGPAGICASNYFVKQGLNVFGADMRSVDTSAKRFFRIPAASEASYFPTLLQIVQDSGISLLIPTVSEELPIIARERDAFAAFGCHVMIAPFLAVDIANDKLKTAQFLERNDFAVPRFLPGNTPHAAVIETLGFPLIAKPRVSRGGRGVVLYTSPEELAHEHRKDIVYQEFMSGDEYDVNLFVNFEGELQSCVVLRKTSLKEGVIGNALAVERAHREDIAQMCARIAKTLGLTGPTDIDIRLDGAGVPRLLEINARLGANALSANEVMDDLLADWNLRKQLTGETL